MSNHQGTLPFNPQIAIPGDITYGQLSSVLGSPPSRQFPSGANRDTDTDKLDFEGFLSPEVLYQFALYMHKHRRLANGEFRDADNWQKGIPKESYMKSLWRHFFDFWRSHRNNEFNLDAACGILFNTMGYMHEGLKSLRKDSL